MAEQAMAHPRRVSKPPIRKPGPDTYTCKECGCYMPERHKREWRCSGCKAAQKRRDRLKAAEGKKLSRISKSKFKLGLMPCDHSEYIWRAIEERNARDAWRWWVEVKAPAEWLARYNSKRFAEKPWLAHKCAAARFKTRYRADPEYRLKQILRNYDRKAKRGRYGESLRLALKVGTVNCRAAADCGYTIAELRLHLERQFTKKMNWARFNSAEIHMDHIVPLSSFDLSNPDEFKAAWALSNLRPMWAKDNLAKSARRTLLV